MKKNITLAIALTILMLNVKANHLSSDLKLQLFNHAAMIVDFDDEHYQNPTNTFCINDVEPGTHHLTVYKMGEHGSISFCNKMEFTQEIFKVKALKPTGAGDAFTSAFTAALILGLSPLEAVRWAPINSMNVVQYIGAQKGLLSRPDIERLLAAAPADYVPVQIQNS